MVQLTTSGRVIVDDTTAATSTTDGSLQTDGGLSVVKSAVIGDDLDLLSNSAVFKVGSDQPFTLTHANASNTLLASADHRLAFGDAGDYITGDGTDLSVISTGDIILSAAGAQIKPASNDQCALGVAGTAFSDLFLAEGGVINWDSGDMTMTQASNVMTIAGGTLTATLTNALACDTSESGLDGTDYDGSAGVTNWKVDLNDLAAAAVDVANDSIAIVDANDSNGTKKESIVDLVSAMAGAGLTATNGVLSTDAAGTPSAVAHGQQLSEGWNYLTASIIGAMTVSLPNLTAPTPGDTYHFKVAGGVDGTRTVTIACSGAHRIDNETSVVLESPASALSLVYMKSASWSIF